MPHEVWNLGDVNTAQRVQPRQFVGGIEPAQEVVIGRSRRRKRMLVILDAWVEVNDFDHSTDDINFMKYSLALGKDPLNDALLLPVARVGGVGSGTANELRMTMIVEQMFKAQGTMWAAKQVAIDIQEIGTVPQADVDVHMDWTWQEVDWFTWFIGFNRLEASPDGSLVDGERAYA